MGLGAEFYRRSVVESIVNVTRNFVVSSSTTAFNVAKIVSVRASLTISLTKSLRVAGPLVCRYASRSLSSRLSSSRYFGRRRGGEAPCLACLSVSSVLVSVSQAVCTRLGAPVQQSCSVDTYGINS